MNPRFLRLSLLLVLVFLVKSLVVFQLHAHPLLQPVGDLDTAVYVRLARQVASGDLALGAQAYVVSPLYVYFLASVFALTGGSLLAATLAQATLGTLGVGLVFLTARRWFGGTAAWIAAILAAATGIFTFYEAVLLQAALDPFLAALALCLLSRALERSRPSDFLVAGLAFGLFALNRPNVLACAAVVFVLLAIGGPERSALQERKPGRSALQPVGRALRARRWAIAFGLGFVLAVAPVTIRNYLVAGDLVLISAHGGLNFYIGNNPEADGTYHHVAGITPSIEGQARDMRRVAETALGRTVTGKEADDYFYGAAWSWIASEPAHAARLLARKLLLVVNRAEPPLNYSFAYYRDEVSPLLRVLRVGAWLLIPLGVVGLVWHRGGREASASLSRANRGYWIWASFVPAYALSVAAFFVADRYRMPLLVPLCVTAAAALDALLGWARTPDTVVGRALQARLPRLKARPASEGERATTAPRPPRRADQRWPRALRPAQGVGLAVALVLLVQWPLGLDEGVAEERTALALALIDQGGAGEAERAIERAAREHAQPALVHYRAGRAYHVSGRLESAIAHYRRALETDPNQPEAHVRLGQALLDAGRPVEAIPHLQAGYAASVSRQVGAFDLARALTLVGRRDEAARVLALIEPAPETDTESLAALGQLALDLGRADLARRFLAQAVARDPRSATAHEKLGLALALAGETNEAMAQIEEAVRLAPSSATAHLNLAVLYAQAGRVGEARAQAWEALRVKPDYARAREFLEALGRQR